MEGESVPVAPGTYSDITSREVIPGFLHSSVVFMKAGVFLVSEAGPDVTFIDMLEQAAPFLM